MSTSFSIYFIELKRKKWIKQSKILVNANISNSHIENYCYSSTQISPPVVHLQFIDVRSQQTLAYTKQRIMQNENLM